MGTESLNTLGTILLIVQVIVSMALIGLILIQHGKGADAGAAFGSGASSTVFGARGSSSFLSRATAYLATLFFVVSFAMYMNAVKQFKPATPTATTQQTQPSGKTKPVTGSTKTSDSPAPKSKPGNNPATTNNKSGSKPGGDAPAPKSKPNKAPDGK